MPKTELKPLTQSPMSSAWNFRGTFNGYQVWSSRNGKRYAKDTQGRWFQIVVKKDSK